MPRVTSRKIPLHWIIVTAMVLVLRLLGLGPGKGGAVADSTGDQGDQECSRPKRKRKLRPG